MIKYIKRKNLDTQKYDKCIEKALNSRVYAFSWYLDIVADNWDVLVLNDYEAVMPLPWRQKFFIKYVYPPCWTQQLGVFSVNRISEDLVNEFIGNIPSKFKKVTIQFNSGNPKLSLSKTRINYLLSLSNSYEENIKRLNKNRKRELKKSHTIKDIFLDKKLSSSEFLSFLFSQKLPYELSKESAGKLRGILELKRKEILIWGVFKGGILLSAILLIKEKKRITYLLPVSSIEAKKYGIHTLLITELIKEFSDSELILDFEGSMIKGVASFYRSFGSIYENYGKLEMPFKLINR